ncbi:MAG: N-acetylmuramoyl-L-alanine amidase [Verrucomicrobia bacterium]|nr:N-acetylmuramoyl-L-alanine amidase [Verrucomicrobiota bacterium]MBV9672340.1 N-acetylmuramoyl-L-alanine amidase [Verrucomicrobiota bacterium]
MLSAKNELALLIVLFVLSACSSVNKTATSGHFSTVLIDAGHGGKDSGGTSGLHNPLFIREKDVTLDTARRVQAILKRAGLHTVMVRDGDYFVELDNRVALANRLGSGTVLVSIHYNATGSAAPKGVQTFFWHANSHGLATRIQSRVVEATGETNVGVTRRRLRLTRNPEIPCVLCECAYLTNPNELVKVADSNYRQKIAEGIAAGILEQYRIGDSGTSPVPEIWAPLSRAQDGRSF